MNLKIDLSVKFRAMGITFGSYAKTLIIPLKATETPRTLANVNERGVSLVVSILAV